MYSHIDGDFTQVAISELLLMQTFVWKWIVIAKNALQAQASVKGVVVALTLCASGLNQTVICEGKETQNE